jgi:hypothetical protein
MGLSRRQYPTTRRLPRFAAIATHSHFPVKGHHSQKESKSFFL